MPLAEAVAAGGAVVNLGATAIVQAVKPNVGQMVIETTTSLGVDLSSKIPVVGPALSPGVNEVMESFKGSRPANDINNFINK
ncbi:hypothetical protein Cmtc_35110 [Cupriavidus sp. TKC]|nr:hypothetical protein Cmtc_35110 [Cupriavidus sp. TKC]